MSTNAYVLLAIAAVAVLLGGAAGSLLLWRRDLRRALVLLRSRREEIRSARAVLDEMPAAEGDAGGGTPPPEVLMTLEGVSVHMDAEREALETMALPRRLWSVADALGDAAGRVAAEARRMGEPSEGDSVPEGRPFEEADVALRRLCEDYGCENVSPEGGVLYV